MCASQKNHRGTRCGNPVVPRKQSGISDRNSSKTMEAKRSQVFIEPGVASSKGLPDVSEDTLNQTTSTSEQQMRELLNDAVDSVVMMHWSKKEDRKSEMNVTSGTSKLHLSAGQKMQCNSSHHSLGQGRRPSIEPAGSHAGRCPSFAENPLLTAMRSASLST